MQKSCLFIFLSALFVVDLAVAHPQHDFMRKFQSTAIEFPDHQAELRIDNPGRYPWLMNWLFQSVLSWNPTGKRKQYSPQCQPQEFERLRNPVVSTISLFDASHIENYFTRCESEVKGEWSSLLMSSFKMMTMKLDIAEHPFLHIVKFHLPNGVILKGLLALHGDNKKRPMVVIRNGIFSNVQEFLPERYLLMQLFEQGPANVLILENMTSADFIANNKKFSFGGFEEGQQNILIAKILQNEQEPIAKIVQTVSFVGVSLGGHGVITAAILNSANSQSKTKSLVNQFVAICPVVNLRENMDATLQKGFRGAFMDFWAARRLVGLSEKYPNLNKNYFWNWLRLRPGFFNQVMENAEKDFSGGLVQSSDIHYPIDLQKKYFWGANDLIRHFNKIEQPLTILANQEDLLVPYHLNSARIKRSFLNRKNRTFGNYDVATLNKGQHCTLPVSYQWDAVADMMNAIVLTEPESNQKSVPLEIELENLSDEIFLAPFDVSFDVRWPSEGRFVILDILVRGQIKQMVTFNLSLELVDFNFRNAELTDSERRMVERWLNRNLTMDLYKKSGKVTLGMFLPTTAR